MPLCIMASSVIFKTCSYGILGCPKNICDLKTKICNNAPQKKCQINLARQ